MGSLLAGILPSGISRLSETFREWKGISSYFCHPAIVLVGRVSLGFKRFSRVLPFLGNFPNLISSSLLKAAAYDQPVLLRCLWSALIPPIFVRPSHVIKCLFIIHCKSRQFVILSACVLNSEGPRSSRCLHIFGAFCHVPSPFKAN